MKTNDENQISYDRRLFIVKSLKVVAVSGIAGIGFIAACNKEEGDEKKISPPEDLMQEHGLLNRILLIYDNCRTQLLNTKSFRKEALFDAATIIRNFVENYHELQEENYLFPRFEKAGKLTDLVRTLRRQHNAGRMITDRILSLTKQQSNSDSDKEVLIGLLSAFNTMYRPHESREDTILFPAFRKIVSQHEYDSLGEEFEKNEHQLFGEDGFEKMVDKVAAIEKSLGIYELEQFTPAI